MESIRVHACEEVVHGGAYGLGLFEGAALEPGLEGASGDQERSAGIDLGAAGEQVLAKRPLREPNQSSGLRDPERDAA